MASMHETSLMARQSSYQAVNAYWMARLSQIAYVKRSDTDQSPDCARILRELQALDDGFESVDGWNEKSSQGIVVAHRAYVAAAFRGTDEAADWLDNVNAFAMDGPLGRVHTGFHRATNDVWPQMKERIDELRRGDDREGRPRRPLWLTGHSLGGAMATLAAADLIMHDQPFYGAYTFGSPRCGDREFARTFNAEAARRVFRFQNNNDIVTRVPARVMGYSHVGRYVYISERPRALSWDPGFWFTFLDSVRGAVGDVAEAGVDGIKDHDVAEYLDAIEKWGDRPPKED